MFSFLVPLLSGLFSGGAGAAVAGGLVAGGLGLIAQKKEAKRQEAAAAAENAAIRAAEAKSAAAYRDTLRAGSQKQGSGSFRVDGGAAGFSPTLKSLTGQ